MKKRLRYSICSFLLLGVLEGLFLSGCGGSSNNSSPSTQQGGYYVAYDTSRLEWIIVVPRTLSSDQNYYLEFPAAKLQYDIPGAWYLVGRDTIAFIPKIPIASKSSYTVQQSYINYLRASSFVTQVETSEENYWNDIYAQNQVESIEYDDGIPSASAADTPIDDSGN